MLPAINLRTRSTFSLLGSALTPSEIASLAHHHEQPAVALIDRQTLAGTYGFAKASRKLGVQGIVGADFATAAGDVSLIAMNTEGWRNLLALQALAASTTEGLISEEAIVEHGEGLALLAGREGSALACLLASGEADPLAWTRSMLASFAGRLFIEIDRAQDRHDSESALDAISRELGLPLVGTSSATCGHADQHWQLDLLASIAQKRTLEDGRLVRPAPRQHFKTGRDLQALFADAPQLLDNAARLALLCDPEALPVSRKPLLPHYPDARGDEVGMIKTLALQGYGARLAGVPQTEHRAYWDRLNSELDIICAQGFAGYFLIVADFIGWSKRNGIPVGPGRGSGAGSAVAWALGITDLDPIRWGLLFERFINPDRVSLPDFDVDFCQSRREETIAYVRAKYGEDRVVAIGTHGTWGAKTAFRDAARALAIPGGAANAAAELLPGAGGFSLDAKPDEPGYLAPEVLQHFKANETLMRALEMAEPLQGYIRQHGRHAAGIIIADDPVASLVPVMRDPGGGSDYVTEFDMKEVEDSGLVKFDFLGLKTTTIIAEAAQHVRSLPDGQKDLDVLAIPFEDEAVFSMLNDGACQAVFQLESEGMVKSLKQVRPTCFEDLIALVSLYRPGPMENIPAYANRKAGIEPIQLPHPALAPVLEETMGIIVYQEQVMQAARLLAGYTLAEADLLRRAMGKKIQAEMDAQRTRFIEGAAANGIPADRASELFALIDRFAGYGFNKSHAAAYALLLWQSAWLKRHYPAAFYAAALTYSDGDFARIRQIVREAKGRGIQFLPPDVSRSRVAFMPETLDGKTTAVRWGFSGIKGIGTYGRILESACHGKNYKLLADLARDLAPHGQATTQVRALAAAGALDRFDTDRPTAAEHMLSCLRFHASQDDKAGNLLFELDPPSRPNLPAQSHEDRRNDELATMGLSFDEHPLAEAGVLRRLAGAHSLRYLDDLAGCGAVTILARVDRVNKNPRSTQHTVSFSDGTSDLEAVTETPPTEGAIVIAEVARKANEARWRIVRHRESNITSLPARMSLELAPTHDWEAIRTILIASGRGDDRVDILINLGERKHRKVIPRCFTITEDCEAALKARPDVIEVKVERAISA